MTAPWEKPPSTIRSGAIGSVSRKAVSSGTVAWNVVGSGVGIPPSAYQ